jgi:hypothetical protein
VGDPPPRFAISGTIAGGNTILVNLSGDATAWTTTDQWGYYRFGPLGAGSYVVAPAESGCTFGPASLAVAVSGANVQGLDFTVSAQAPLPAPCEVDSWCWQSPRPGLVPTGGVASDLNGVWASGADDAWAVGSYGTILHWDGHAWWSVPAGATSHFSGVWGSAANDVWAVGSSGAIVRWDGTAWARVPNPAAGRSLEGLLGVWGSGPSDVWAVGYDDGILHWDGGAWTLVAIPPGSAPGGLHAVWGSGPGDVWAVGNATILHWNGSAWSLAATASSDAFLYGVWGSAADDVWAVGRDSFGGWTGHWDGVAWLRTGAGQNLSFNGVTGSRTNDAWKVGGDPYGSAVIDHWNGAAWTGSRWPGLPLLGVWSTSSSDVWAVGTRGAILRRRP